MLLESFRVLNEESEEVLNTEEKRVSKGDLVIDAAVVPVDVRPYPSDFKLLDETRMVLESLIDKYYAVGSEDKKPRTNKKVAKIEFNKISKQRKIIMNKRKKVVKKQLTYVSKDIKIIKE